MCGPESRSPPRASGCSTTFTSSPPRSATSVSTCPAPTTASCPRSRRVSRRGRRGSARWPSSWCDTSGSTASSSQCSSTAINATPRSLGELWAGPTRKLALIENLGAWPPRRSRRVPRGATDAVDAPGRRRRPGARPLPRTLTRSGRLLHQAKMRAAALARAGGGPSAPRGAGHDARSAIRGEHRWATSGLDRQRRHQPAPVLGDRLAAVSVGQP